jgi:dTDP-4-amino-4,6-dideoxygalactose transaminase
VVPRESILANKTITLYGVDRQYQKLKREILDVTDSVLGTGQLLDGTRTSIFEHEMAHRCNRAYAVTVNSATQGLIFAAICGLKAVRSRVLLPAVSFIATLNSVLLDDRYDVDICDVDANGLMDLGLLEESLTRREFSGIMYANLFGNTVDWDRFQIMSGFFGQDDMYIIEDAAQSFGASSRGVPSGKMGTVSVLSFDPTKNLNNYGSGGMILTDDQGIRDHLLDLKNNGKEFGNQASGTNSKMSEVDCAQMTVKLQYFDAWQARRTEIANYYTEQLSEYVDVPGTTAGTVPAWSKYVIRTTRRNTLRQHLTYNNIETKVTYNKPLYQELVARHLHQPQYMDAWESERFTRECLSLPIYPELRDSEVERIAKSVKDYFR